MNSDGFQFLKEYYGEGYPAAIVNEGVRVPLTSESRWSRSYTEQGNMTTIISRLMDGSAAINYPEFIAEWPEWSEEERRDFYQSCSFLHKQADFPDMLRFIMQQGGPEDWFSIAGEVGRRLPQEEAFRFLTGALPTMDLDHATNIYRGISLTRHPSAEALLRDHLAALWAHPALWDDDSTFNSLAHGATCGIAHLIAVGAPPEDFKEQVRALAAHPCAGNRKSCRFRLGEHYPWLNDLS